LTVTLVLISLAAFFTSSLTAAMGVGGGVILLALLAQIVPSSVVIPLHGAAQLVSNTSRVFVQRQHINWTYILPFFIGGVIGAAILTPWVQDVPDGVGELLLGIFILIATWRAQWLGLSQWHPSASGGVTTGLSLILGATGPLVMSVLPRGQWTRQMVVGTHGMAMVLQHGIKVIAFSSMDFDWSAWWPMLIGITLGTIAGNQFGALLLGRWEEAQFKKALDILLTVLAIRLAWQGLEKLLV
jgi:uncharacterized membrane protein YfcA